MSKQNYLECDVCNERIERTGLLVNLKARRGAWLKLQVYKWFGGYASMADDRWVGKRTDICEDCWEEVLDEVRDRVKA